MPQKEVCPKGYQPVAASEQLASTVQLQSSSGKTKFDFSFEAVRRNLFRVTFSSAERPLPPYPSITRPETNLQGLDVSARVEGSSKIIDVADVTAQVEWEHTPVVTLSWKGAKDLLHRDLPLRSYVADGPGVAHYSVHDRKALHVGLGEKAAPMDLSGRDFQLSATDCFGYDVHKSDPLYKHIPLLIKASPQGCVALFSTTHGRGLWSVGSEIDGLWGHFKIYRQDYGGLEQYMIVGRTIKEVVHSYAELVGFPLPVPRWAYGYISGGYKYTMLDDADKALLELAEKLKKHGIPCSAHQMSSGYSIAPVEPKVRNVFTWNNERFPNPQDWISQMHEHGIRLITNIKPFLLASHPDFQRLIDGNGFFTDPETDKPGYMRLWSAGGATGGDGCHIDFTSEAAFKWWFEGVKSLKKVGIDGMWNDNNEYTLPNDDWTLALDETMVNKEAKQTTVNNVGQWGRAMHTELMGKSSHDALVDMEPNVRPFVLTRSATPGTMRYSASTWSGDNVTSWDSMKGSNALSLNAGISLLQCEGHDIGGFEGPQPSPELLLRWIQLGCMSTRFAINCFKTSPNNNSVGEVIEPFMYPEITHLVRDAIKRRYEMLPYIYSLALESHKNASPVQRWIGWGYEFDPEVWNNQTLKDGEEQFWLGDSIVVGGVFNPGVTSAKIYLPRKSGDGFDYGYVNMNAPYNYFASGQWVDVESQWRESIPLIAKIGGAIPVGKDVHTRIPDDKTAASQGVSEIDDYRGVEIFPPQGTSHGRTFSNTWYEDDGISRQPRTAVYTLSYSSTEEKVLVHFERDESAGFVPAWKELDIILHHKDTRRVVTSSGQEVVPKGLDARGRLVFTIKA
ncbi:Alpha-glucosidase [Penicillium ucsense]|uniref:alpha-glucosidase n=1 Tax=Penicillium ucsense TaxID=2839758 RepID=A0A8J8WH55_9EURO|nr:Alpha-glucosidase [Penicillium ucsense]KAF7736697.1 Alpha-glucosidase [Penicillium ucsense]